MSEIQEILEGRLLAAQQELTEEMKRLLGRELPPAQDRRHRSAASRSTAEYIIFVIDTSGSYVLERLAAGSTRSWPR